MGKEIIFGVATSNDMEDVFRFHDEYNRGMRSLKVFNWQYGDYSQSENLLVVGKADNSLVATYGYLRFPISVDGDMVLSGKGETTLIDKQYRGLEHNFSLYKNATDEFSKQKPACVWGITRSELKPLMKAYGRKVYEKPISLMLVAFKYKALMQLGKEKISSNVLRILLAIASLPYLFLIKTVFFLKSWNFRKSKLSVMHKLKNKNDIITMYQRIRANIPDLIHLHYDEEFMSWRIDNSPVPIKQYFVYKGDQLCGYMFIAVNSNDLTIIDLTFETNVAAYLLVKEMMKLVLKLKPGLIMYYGNKENELGLKSFNILSKHGFIKLKGLNNFTLKVVEYQNEAMLYDINNWHLNGVWLEGI
ncbi:MAG TPA: hypothetical protein GX525_02915 [Bacilli bacterium]|nr:hypothetical protein [Bacilli bacterium]